MSIYAAPLVIRLRPSNLGRAALLMAALSALAAIVLADLPNYARLGATLAVGALVLHAWRARQPLALKLNPDGRLEWREAASPWQPAGLLARSIVGPWLCLLALRVEGRARARNLAILPDSLNAEDFRRLRVWLRWRAELEGSGPTAHDAT